MQILPNMPLNIRLLSANRRKWIRSKYTVEVSIWRGESISGNRRRCETLSVPKSPLRNNERSRTL